jgi:methyl-accepting chemotaxis protein
MDQELQSRLDFIGLDPEKLQNLAKLSEHVNAHLPASLDQFYDKIATVSQVSAFFTDPGLIDHAKGRQLEHWQTIAAGCLDDAYFRKSTAIGEVHARIGLEPRWYIGGYALIVEGLVKGVVNDFVARTFDGKGGFLTKTYGPRDIARGADEMSMALANLLKAAFLDIDIAVSTYFNKTAEETTSLNQQISQVVGKAKQGDFSARVDMTPVNPELADLASSINELMASVGRGVEETAHVLAALSNTDLTQRMRGEFSGAFAQLQHDTNAVAERLTEIVGQLQTTSRSLKTATGEILVGANDLSERTTKQAATIEETSAAIEQLANTVQQNSRRAEEAASNTGKVTRDAEEGGEVMNQTTQAMTRITQSSSKISNIIGMIDDIAFQTNLLALNASVEAARAGEAGKGFAVVAIEVRRLAQSAAEASSEVKALIEQSATEVKTGSGLVESAAAKLETMLEAVRKNAGLMKSIASESREQSAAIDEVNVAVKLMDEMTQHNAALVEETNAAIEQTEAQASELDSIVEVFNVTGRDERPAARPVRQPAPARKPARNYLSNGNAALDSDWQEF